MNRYFGMHVLEGEWHALLPRYTLLSSRVRDKRVLDIGCGTGIGSSLLLEFGARSVTGIDHRPDVIDLARIKHDKEGLAFRVMFWEALELSDDAFDIVLCLDPSSPVTDPNLLAEVRRVLAEGGEYICAVERTNLEGLETLLPRYGYAAAAESIDIAESSGHVPQLGELADHFSHMNSVLQRPHLSYRFERPQTSAASDDDAAAADHQLPPLAVDTRLCEEDCSAPSVELLFCSDSQDAPPPQKDVQLPYSEVVERLQLLMHDSNLRASPDSTGRQPLDHEQSVNTGVWKLPEDSDAFDQATTQVRSRPRPSASEHRQRVDSLEHDVAELTRRYHDMQWHVVDHIARQQRVLDERDRYIDHLVKEVLDLRTQPATLDADQPRQADHVEELERLRRDRDRLQRLLDDASDSAHADQPQATRDPAAQDDVPDPLDSPPDGEGGDEE